MGWRESKGNYSLRNLQLPYPANRSWRESRRRVVVLIEHVIILMLITFIIGLFTGVSLARPRE